MIKFNKYHILFISFLTYLVLHFLTIKIVLPLQAFLSVPMDRGAILYLPSSIRIFIVWLFGFYGFILSIISSFSVSIIEGARFEDVLKNLPLTLGSPLAIFVAFYVSAGWATRPSDWVFAFRSWQKLSLVAALGGFINGVGFAIFHDAGSQIVLTVMIGDVLGLWVGYTLMLFFANFFKRLINSKYSL